MPKHSKTYPRGRGQRRTHKRTHKRTQRRSHRGGQNRGQGPNLNPNPFQLLPLGGKYPPPIDYAQGFG